MTRRFFVLMVGLLSMVLVACDALGATGAQSNNFDWTLAQTLTSPDDGLLREALVVHDDVLIVPELRILRDPIRYVGGIAIFQREDGNWTYDRFIEAPVEEEWEVRDAVAYDGNTLLIGLDAIGTAVYPALIYNDQFEEIARFEPSALSGSRSTFPESAAIAGETVFFGSGSMEIEDNTSGVVYAYERNDEGTYEQVQVIQPETDQFIYSGAFGRYIVAEGDTLAIFAQREVIDADVEFDDQRYGVLYIYTRGEDAWTLAQRLPVDPGYGLDDLRDGSIAMDGNTIMVGMSGDASSFEDTGVKGAVYVFTRADDGAWSQTQVVQPASVGDRELFGTSLALHGDMALVGAPGANDAATESGAVYVLGRADDGTWSQIGRFAPSDAEEEDRYGSKVFLTDTEAFISSFGGDHIYVLRPPAASE